MQLKNKIPKFAPYLYDHLMFDKKTKVIRLETAKFSTDILKNVPFALAPAVFYLRSSYSSLSKWIEALFTFSKVPVLWRLWSPSVYSEIIFMVNFKS